MMCGSTEIDGYAFCLGLKSLRRLQTLSFPKLQSLPALTNLMERAGLRPKYTTNSLERYSLEIRSLAELVDMFHTRQASDPLDKVYALLGMSSDDPWKAGLQPDYNISWEGLFQKLVKFILGEDVLVEPSSATIKGKGCILGQVSSVQSDNGQSVSITSTNTAWSSREWFLQVSAKSVRKGDIVCLLKGASKPTIIRLSGDYFVVIIIAATPLIESEGFEQPELPKSIHFSRDFLLVWDWEDPLEDLQDQEKYESRTKNSQVQDHSKAELGDHLDKVTRIWNVALVLADLKEYRKAEERLREAIKGYEMANREEYPYMLKSHYGLTPLSWIAGNGYDPAVKLLLAKNDIDPDLRDGQYSRTPLSWAAEGGHEAVVKLLLETSKVKVDSRDCDGRTPILWAAEGGHMAVVKLLLETDKAEVNSKDSNSRTPLLEAANGGHEAVVKLLLETDKAEIDSKDRNGRTPLLEAAKGGHEAVVKLLLKTNKAEITFKDRNGWTPLLEAAQGGHLAIVELLLQKKAEVNIVAADNRGRTALQAAAEGGHLAIVERLLQEKAEVNAKAASSNGRTVLQAAAEGGHLAIVERLLQEKAEVNAAAASSNGRTALQAAAEGGHLAIVKRLLQEKAEVNAAAAYSNGRTALQAAAEGGYLAIVERLIQEKAEVDAKAAKYNGRTALQAAADGSHLAIMKCLRGAGAI